MSDRYPIVEVDPEWETGPEQMGSKRKFWFRRPEDPDGPNWLFKFPQGDTGGHWAEKIAYEIAGTMRSIEAPPVELAICRTADGELRRGSITQSFSPKGYGLHHGNQILHSMDVNYDPEQKFKQKMHTIRRIFSGMDIFKDGSFANQCRAELAGYLIFDAVIGNVDRHHENWGILRKRVGGEWRGRLAPTFDHASSLGRELLDTGSKKSRKRYLDELGIEGYAKRAHGAVFITEASSRGPSPLELIRWCVREADYRQFFERAFRELDLPDPEEMREVVEKIPDGWMTPVSRTFAGKLLHYNCERLQEIFR